MHKLDLDTLSEERLKKAIDQETYQLGQDLFEAGQVQLEGINTLQAGCVVHDKRNYNVQLKISTSHLLFKCDCIHGSRGLICEHDVAAWLAIRAHLLGKVPPVWRTQVTRMLNSIQAAPARNLPAPYLLFFSLQEDISSGESTWNISPYYLPLNDLAQELTPKEGPREANAYSSLIEGDPNLGLRSISAYHSLDPDGCQNCTREGVNLANLIIERERTYTSHIDKFPLDDYLNLIASTNSPLFLGGKPNPLGKELEILAESGEIRLRLEKKGDNLHINAILIAGGQPIALERESTRIIQTSTTWALIDHFLFPLDFPGSSELLSTLQKTPEIIIPPEQEDDFLKKYYLALARKIPVEGNVVSWEILQEEPVPHLYLSDLDGEMSAQLRFAYGETEVRYDPNPPAESVQRKPESWTLVRVQRRTAAEKNAYNKLSSATYGLKRAPRPAKPGIFRLRVRTHPVDFLLRNVPRLVKDGFVVYGEEQLKSARVNRNTPTISFDVSSEIDWFDLKAVVNFGELVVSLKDIRRAMQKRERFIKLADGSIGEIPEEWFELYKHLFALGESKGDSLRLSRHHLTLIDRALADADGAQVDVEFKRRRQQLHHLMEEGFRGITPMPLPSGFTGELRPYQKAGYNWLHFLREFEFGGCLADDMGLGKTIQALAFLQSLYECHNGAPPPPQASLLVVPRSLLVNWQREVTRFTPNLRLLEYFESTRSRDRQSFDQVDLVVTTYGVMLRDIEFLHGYSFFYAVLDESQAIKNPNSQTARAAHLLQARHRLVLTGTPIENATSELWSQFNFLNPGLLGRLRYFKREFATPIEKKADEGAAETLRRLVYPFILRRTKDQVAPELPPRSERILYSDMEPAQREMYNRTRDYYRGMLLGLLEEEGLDKSRMKILEGLLRLRQISNHPRLVDGKFRGHSGKFDLLLETLKTLHSEGHKALVFSQFVQMLKLVRKELDKDKMPYTYLDGSTQNRQEQVDTFQANEGIPFFLISLKAGGLGLNLTAADYVIHIDPWWNPAVEMQASDRTHRIGQDKPVFIFKLIARDSVEEKILVLQERKKNLVDQIITTESSFFKSLTIEDIQVLFGS